MPVLLITRSPSVHDSVVPLCAAAGVGAEVCAEPSLSLAAWREADLVLVGDDLAGALADLAPPRRADVHVVGVAVGDTAFRHAVELGAASVVDLPAGEGWRSDELADVGELVGQPFLAGWQVDHRRRAELDGVAEGGVAHSDPDDVDVCPSRRREVGERAGEVVPDEHEVGLAPCGQ